MVESDSDGLSNLIRTLVNLFFVEIISRFLVEIRVESIRDFFWIFTLNKRQSVPTNFRVDMLWLSHEFVGRDVLRDRGLQLINVPFRFIQTI